mgnify:FL=1
MQALQQVSGANNPDALSSGTDENTQLQLDAKPVTKALYEKQWYRQQYTRRVAWICELRNKEFQQYWL